jgi:hypothetical protein
VFFDFANVGQKSHVTGAFDCAGQLTLVLGATASNAARKDFGVLAQKLFQTLNVFKVNRFNAPFIKFGHFLTTTTGTAATTTTKRTATAAALATTE